MLGLVGDSAAGKTTLVRGVVRLLGRQGVTPLCLDDYHRYGRAERDARGITASDPAANNLELMAEHLAVLRAGGTVRKPVYDHRSGTLRGSETVMATGLVVAYGMLTLTPPNLAGLFDLSVYLEPNEALRQQWRLVRDVAERGYHASEVHSHHQARERDATRFIRAQRRLADTVVRFRPSAAFGAASLDVEITLRHGEAPHVLDSLCGQLAEMTAAGMRIARDLRDEDGRRSDRLVVEAAIAPAIAAQVAAALWETLPNLAPSDMAQLGQIRSGGTIRRSDALALTQLILVCQMVQSRGDR